MTDQEHIIRDAFDTSKPVKPGQWVIATLKRDLAAIEAEDDDALVRKLTATIEQIPEDDRKRSCQAILRAVLSAIVQRKADGAATLAVLTSELHSLLGFPKLAIRQEFKVAKARAREDEYGERDTARDDDVPEGSFLRDPEPWPEPVPGDRLLDRLVETIADHLVLPTGAAEAIAAWVIFAHAHDCFAISPILGVTSPSPECGKTTLLTLLGGLVPRPLPASNITTAPLFRSVEKWQPTILIDEADTFLRNSDELRGVLNSGHARGSAFVIRSTGEDHEPRAFRTWCPKAVALIGPLPATLASRAIHIKLRRKATDETVKPLRADRLKHLEPLARQVARWVKDNADRLRSIDPEMPQELYGRPADNWRPILAIADAAGGEWPKRLRDIAVAFAGRRTEQTYGIMALEDIRSVFAERDVDRLSSQDLVEAMADMEDRPWPEYKNGKPISTRQLAKLLGPFGAVPKSVRIGTKTPQGYYLSAFEDAFRRYLPPASRTPAQPAENSQKLENLSRTQEADVLDTICKKSQKSRPCAGVLDGEPVSGEKETKEANNGDSEPPPHVHPVIDAGPIPPWLDRRPKKGGRDEDGPRVDGPI